jgi:hypothetical protein
LNDFNGVRGISVTICPTLSFEEIRSFLQVFYGFLSILEPKASNTPVIQRFCKCRLNPDGFIVSFKSCLMLVQPIVS